MNWARIYWFGKWFVSYSLETDKVRYLCAVYFSVGFDHITLSFKNFFWGSYFVIVCPPPPFSKGGGTKILKIPKRGEPEKKFWGRGNQKGGGKIFKNKGGNPTF